MTKTEEECWIINFDDVVKQLDTATIKFICSKYNINDIYKLNSYNYQDVWNELYYYMIENDTS